MSSDKPVTPGGTGDGTVVHVSSLTFATAIIAAIGTSLTGLLATLLQVYLSSQHEVNRQQDAQKVLAKQDTTIEKQDVTHDELKQVKALATEALPPQVAKPLE